jgi:hypothetical protein
MAKSKTNGVNKSAAIRELFKQNPQIKAQEIVSSLATKGIQVSKNLVYLVKGQTQGEQTRRRRVHRSAANVARASGSADAVKTILKVKSLASEVGGLDNLKALVEALDT